MLVKFNATRVLGFKDVLVIPGVNILEDDLVSDMLDHPIISLKFESGELECIDKEDLGVKAPSKKGKALSGVELLLAANDKSAKELVGKTVDLTILSAWSKREKRPAIKKAVDVQISKIRDIKYREEKDKQKLERSRDDDDSED